jgi:hypothetical protein
MIGHFRLFPFLAGVAIAAVVFMIYKPEKQIIHKYPHPSDAASKIFKDPNGVCYKYSSRDVNCDANEATLKEYPVQG